ncbi:MAG TPA: tetratricopeptide repeat protein [Gemmataceae bacterium]|nr:tetratricopeptide repeat protein [Gemmataceae bacterium]
MDCRKWALMACVAASCVGCVTETKSLPVSPENWTKMKGVKEIEVPKHEAKPQTFIAVGNLEESKASNPKAGPAEQNVFRDEARKYYQKAIEIDPQCVQAYIQLANLYLKQDDTDRALTVYQHALQQNPKVAQLWYDLGVIQCRRKDLNAALQGFAKAHELEPENRHYATDYGLYLARAGKPQEAVVILSKVMNKADANYDVARMMDHLKQQDLCRQYLQAALTERGQHQGAQDLLAQLDRPAAVPATQDMTAQYNRPATGPAQEMTAQYYRPATTAATQEITTAQYNRPATTPAAQDVPAQYNRPATTPAAVPHVDSAAPRVTLLAPR